MRILTDCPDQIDGAALGLTVKAHLGIDALALEERSLWQALASGSDLCMADTAPGIISSFWRQALVAREAPVSQFDGLNALLRTGIRLSGPVACLALHGRNFRGQRGRRWVGAPGNLQLCAALQPAEFPAGHGRALAMLPCVAVVEAVRSVTGGTVRPGIKWVNDILAEGRKIGGVLIATQVLGERISQVVLGIGLNVAIAPDVPPTPFVPATGSLAGAGARVTVVAVFIEILNRIAELFGALEARGPGEVFELYRSASVVIGRDVCLWEESADESEPGAPLPPPTIRGRVLDIAPDLSLLIEGQKEPISRGRLAFAEFVPAAPP